MMQILKVNSLVSQVHKRLGIRTILPSAEGGSEKSETKVDSVKHVMIL